MCCWDARLVRPGAPWLSFRFILFTQIHPGCRSVRSGSSGSFLCALMVAGFVRVPLVRFRAP